MVVFPGRHHWHRLAEYVITRLIGALLFSIALFAHCDTELDRLDKVKVDYIFNITKYIIWPKGAFENEFAPIHLCLTAEDSYEIYARERLHGRVSKGRSIVISKPEEIDRPCHMIYIQGSKRVKVPNQSTILISDREGWKAYQSSIVLHRKNKRIQFEVLLYNLEKTGAKLSSELLKLAKVRR